MIEFREFRYDPESRLLYRGPDEIFLSPRVLAVLESLLKRPGKVVLKDDVLASAWDGAFVGEDSLTQAVSQLRQALGDDPRRPTYIQTIPRRGYRFIADVSEPLRDAPPIPAPSGSRSPDAGPSSGGADPPELDRAPGDASEVIPLGPGARLGSYEILDRIGAGAMGEVWRGRDVELRREVAIKVVPTELASDPEVMQRFRREARLLASVNHPNIATIHGVEETSDAFFIVMELLEGEPLQQRLDDGPIPVGEALELCRQVAAGLEAAHENGIMHRDLKPANVLVTRGGLAKVLDFGLAKDARPDPLDATTDPTSLTKSGMLLGTAPYMSPEQVRGQQTDKRADIWAFGCLLYEMVTGKRLFAGDAVADVVVAIVSERPDWRELPDDLPPGVVRLLKRCLEREPMQRLRDIGEARVLLEGISEGAEPTAEPLPETVVIAPPRMSLATLGAAALGIVGLAFGAWTIWASNDPVEPSLELALAAPEGTEFSIDSLSGDGGVISPDGDMVAFVASDGEQPRLWVRPLSGEGARPLTGTEGAFYPFWSPDSTRLGYFTMRELKTIDVAGGLPEVVAEVVDGRGGSWGADDSILFASAAIGIRRLDADGTLTQITTLDADRAAHYRPVYLPGDDRFLYVAGNAGEEYGAIHWGHLDGSVEPRRLVAALSGGIYAPPGAGGTGHLLWVRDSDLVAQPFDPETGELSGTATVIVGDVRVDAFQFATFAHVSDNGRLVWASQRAGVIELAWYNRSGMRLERLAGIEPGAVWRPTVSPDGTKVLFVKAEDNGDYAIWIHDIETGITRPASGRGAENESWSPDGQWMVYEANGVILTSPYGTSEARTLYEGPLSLAPHLTPDNRWVVFAPGGPDSGDIWAVPADQSESPFPITDDPGNETVHGFSPDGRWLLIVSDRSGRDEVYAVRWITGDGRPRLGPRWIEISIDGGSFPGWTREGREVVFISGDGHLMAVPVIASETDLTVGRAKRLMPIPLAAHQSLGFGIAPDGERFLFCNAPYAAGQTLGVLINWQARLSGDPTRRP